MPFSVLRNLELEAKQLYDRANKLYKAAILIRCYVQHFHSPYIDSEFFLILHSIFKDTLVISSIQNYFNNSETPIICYKYKKTNRSSIYNFNKIVTNTNIDSNTPDS